MVRRTLLELLIATAFVAVRVDRCAAVGISDHHIGSLQATRTTNAERLARGLPPLRPKRLYDPVRAALAPRQSITPPPGITGPLAIYLNSDLDTPYCYLTKGACECAAGSTPDDSYVWSAPSPGSTQANVMTTDSDLDLTFYLQVEAFFGTTLTPTNQNYAGIADGFTSTDPGSPPAGDHGISETAVWTIGQDGTLTPYWVNPDDGGTYEGFIFVDVNTNVFVTADPDYLSSDGYDTAVTFKLVPQ